MADVKLDKQTVSPSFGKFDLNMPKIELPETTSYQILTKSRGKVNRRSLIAIAGYMAFHLI